MFLQGTQNDYLIYVDNVKVPKDKSSEKLNYCKSVGRCFQQKTFFAFYHSFQRKVFCSKPQRSMTRSITVAASASNDWGKL